MLGAEPGALSSELAKPFRVDALGGGRIDP
jgi:hypothetical protein